MTQLMTCIEVRKRKKTNKYSTFKMCHKHAFINTIIFNGQNLMAAR